MLSSSQVPADVWDPAPVVFTGGLLQTETRLENVSVDSRSRDVAAKRVPHTHSSLSVKLAPQASPLHGKIRTRLHLHHHLPPQSHQV